VKHNLPQARTIAHSIMLHINTNGLIRYDSHSLISSKNHSTGESVRMTNVNYTNFLSTLFISWITNHELCITNRKYVHSL